jgi:hypothetical protein
MLLANQMTLQAGLETTPGTDPVLTGTAGFLAYDININPAAGTFSEDRPASADWGADLNEPSEVYQTLTFKTPFAGSGAAGTAAYYGCLMQACGLLETITETTKVEYTTQNWVEATAKASSIYFDWGGVMHKMPMSRGTLSIVWARNTVPMLQWSMTGLATPAADVAFPDVKSTVAALLRGVPMNKANTIISIHGITPPVESLQIDLGNVVAYSNVANSELVAITDRIVTGTIQFRKQPIATFDPVARYKAKTTGTLSLTHGTVAGNIVKIDGARVQFGQPTHANVNGFLCDSIPLRFAKAPAGNGDLKLTVQ